MTRSVGRLNEVVQSLNPRAVNDHALVYLRGAMKLIIHGGWASPSMMQNLEWAVKNNPSPHVRDLAQDVIYYINQKGLTNG